MRRLLSAEWWHKIFTILSTAGMSLFVGPDRIGLLELRADAWHNIAGRGWVAAISNGEQQLPEDMSLSELLHQYVRIDGKVYLVTAVECQGRSRHKFGLVVRGDKCQK